MARALSALFLALPLLCSCATSPSRGPATSRPAAPPAPPAEDVAVEEGVTLYRQGHYAEAAARLAPASSVRALAYLAASRVRLEQYAEAEAPALQALAASPGDAVASAALGEALVAQGRLDEAIQRLTAVLEADPALPYTHYWRGQAYQRKKQIARMVEDYEAFLRLAPDAPEAPALRALLASLR